jgi:hypothetical protein
MRFTRSEFLRGVKGVKADETTRRFLQNVVRDGKPTTYIYGNLLQRVIYLYWYHLGKNLDIRQQLGHTRLPQFVGNIDDQASYRPG